MSHATPRPSSLQRLVAWLVLAALWSSAATFGCSPRQATADASSVADVGADAGVDVGGDHLVSADVLQDDGWELGQAEVVDVADVDAAEGADGDGADGEDVDGSDADAVDGMDVEAVDLDAADAADLDDEDAGDLNVAGGTDVDAADAADLDSADDTDVDAANAADLDAAAGTDVDAADAADLDVADSTDLDAADAVDMDVAAGTDVDAADAEDALDSVEVLDVIAVDGDAAVDAAPGCTATDIPAPLTGTVEFDFSPLVPNKVVTGCGKGPPQPVKDGAPGCCNCPPPYSCYCNGECGWLRAPDLVKPQNNGQAVWTGKWVVSLAESYQLFEKPSTMHLQRWQPGSGKGFELVPLPTPWLPSGIPVALLLGKKVVLASRAFGLDKKYEYGPDYPAYLYDPETNVFTLIKMPVCFKLVAAGGTLVCMQVVDDSKTPIDPGALYVFDPTNMTWFKAPEPTSVAPPSWLYVSSNLVVANGGDVYFFGAVIGYAGTWADGSPTGLNLPEHLLKYNLTNKLWTDFGAVIPQFWTDAYFLAVDHFGIVVAKYSLKNAARFRLDTLKWENAPSVPYLVFGAQELKLTPCGLLFGSGEWFDVPMNGGMTHKPLLLRNDLSWQSLPSWGYPDEFTTARKLANVVLTDKEIYMLGGMNGPPDGGFVFHKDSYRYPLAALCNGVNQ